MSAPEVQVVDMACGPLSDPGGEVWRDTVSRTRRELRLLGCSVVADFIGPSLREVLRQECVSIAPLAHYGTETVNAYNIATDIPLPDGHPGRTVMTRGNAFVARDHIPRGTVIERLYTSRLFQRFVAECFGLPEVHELADPLS